jgi:hypothetical protein
LHDAGVDLAYECADAHRADDEPGIGREALEESRWGRFRQSGLHSQLKFRKDETRS